MKIINSQGYEEGVLGGGGAVHLSVKRITGCFWAKMKTFWIFNGANEKKNNFSLLGSVDDNDMVTWTQ